MAAADPLIDSYPCAQIRLRESTFERDGVTYLSDHDEMVSVPFVPPMLCNHEDQDRVDDEGARICPNCLESWLHDWEVFLPADSLRW